METKNIPAIILEAISHPIIMINKDDFIIYANTEAEEFFKTSASILSRTKLADLIFPDTPLFELIENIRINPIPMNEYRTNLFFPRSKEDKIADIFLQPVPELSDHIVIFFQEKTLAEKLDRQFIHRGAARSVTGLASMLAHEIKNPLSGIRGAAQLLETTVQEEDKALTQLIKSETDRIVALVDRMEIFSDEHPLKRSPINIYDVLHHVKLIAQNGFAKDITFIEEYDPSLPSVLADRDQLIQIFLNLVKNAAEAFDDQDDRQIILSSAYRPGMHIHVPESAEKIALPLEFSVEDNGSGISEDILPNLFDPFITGKTNGSGLGLALVAKLVKDHGGFIECNSRPGKTVFKILLPMSQNGNH